MAKIAICEGGHSVCLKCKDQLKPAICPVCKEGFSRGRNYTLEDVVATTTFPCKYMGCTVKLYGKDMRNHELECQYRPESCILKFNGCNWKGTATKISNHIHQIHAEYIDKFNFCETHDVYVQFLFRFTHLFVLFDGQHDNLRNITGMFIPLRMNGNTQNEFKLRVECKSPKKKGYELTFSSPCIKRCSVSKIFNTDRITIDVDTYYRFKHCTFEINKI